MQRYAMILLVLVGGTVCLAFLVLLGNCVLFQRTCPPQGSLREVLEDVLTATIGFTAGRYTK